MSRYILIDNNSGCILGDSADLNGKHYVGTPEEYAAALDRSVGEVGRTYTLINHNPRSAERGYQVYRADVGDGEAVPVVHDGQDRDTIDAVGRDCEYVGFIRIRGRRTSMTDWQTPLIDATADSPDGVLGNYVAALIIERIQGLPRTRSRVKSKSKSLAIRRESFRDPDEKRPGIRAGQQV